MTTQEFAAYAMAYAAFAVLAVLSTVAFVEAWLARGKIIAALRGHPVPQADLEAPHASASTQLRRDRSAVEPTREAA